MAIQGLACGDALDLLRKPGRPIRLADRKVSTRVWLLFLEGRGDAARRGTGVKARIQAAESVQRERWLERILTAKSADELFG